MALKRHAGVRSIGICRRIELDAPEVDIRIEKSDSVRVEAVFVADLTDDANLCLSVVMLLNDDQLLLDAQLMRGQDTRTVMAENNGLRLLDKCSPPRVPDGTPHAHCFQRTNS